jgi:hypothetical protein
VAITSVATNSITSLIWSKGQEVPLPICRSGGEGATMVITKKQKENKKGGVVARGTQLHHHL